MEKESALILLLLKSMTTTSHLNDIAIMIYHGGCPVLKQINSLFLAIILMKITWKTKNKKEFVSLLELITKTSQLNEKFKEDVFRRVLSPKWPFKMVAWRRSQWGGVFYDYRLKLWLFYGYRLFFSVAVNKKVKD